MAAQPPRPAPPPRDRLAPAPKPLEAAAPAYAPAVRGGSDAAASPLARTALSQTGAGHAPAPPGSQDAARAAVESGVVPSQHAPAKEAGRAGASGGRPEGKTAAAASGKSSKVASFPVVDTDGHTKYRLGDGLEPSPAFPRGRSLAALRVH